MKHAIIKISGDLISNKSAIDFIRRQTEMYYVTVIPGAGTQISNALREAGIPTKFDEMTGARMHSNDESRRIAMGILNEVAAMLAQTVPGVNVLCPYVISHMRVCHFNSDDYLKLLAPSYDMAYCLTTSERGIRKQDIMSGKIIVVPIEREAA